MIRSILFATDGLPANAAARQSAIELAARFEAKLTALGIVDAPWITGGEAVPLGGAAYKVAGEVEQLRSGHEHVQAALQACQAAATASGITAATAELEGDPLELISAEANAHDLVVIGRATRFHLGTGEGVSPLLKTLARDIPRPILATADAPTKGARVLVAFDGSAAASRAMHMAALLGLTRDGEVEVLSIDDDARIAEQRAERAAALLRSHDGKVAAFGIQSGAEPAEMILSHVQTFGADLVVMGAYGHAGLRDMIFGSCTRRLLADCTAALFLQH